MGGRWSRMELMELMMDLRCPPRWWYPCPQPCAHTVHVGGEGRILTSKYHCVHYVSALFTNLEQPNWNISFRTMTVSNLRDAFGRWCRLEAGRAQRQPTLGTMRLTHSCGQASAPSTRTRVRT
ncbi:hypothetical protein LIA77_10160 [Sarocladium implicatum]|nr:hypothetical protein LIA77_10160 [Sarocladium implicatum]